MKPTWYLENVLVFYGRIMGTCTDHPSGPDVRIGTPVKLIRGLKNAVETARSRYVIMSTVEKESQTLENIQKLVDNRRHQ